MMSICGCSEKFSDPQTRGSVRIGSFKPKDQFYWIKWQRTEPVNLFQTSSRHLGDLYQYNLCFFDNLYSYFIWLQNTKCGLYNLFSVKRKYFILSKFEHVWDPPLPPVGRMPDQTPHCLPATRAVKIKQISVSNKLWILLRTVHT